MGMARYRGEGEAGRSWQQKEAKGRVGVGEAVGRGKQKQGSNGGR